MSFWVYILASKRNGTLYTGHTDNLPERIWQHREELKPGFTSKHHVHTLVWAAPCPTREEAKSYEKRSIQKPAPEPTGSPPTRGTRARARFQFRQFRKN